MPIDITPELSVSLDKTCYIIMRARAFDAKDVRTDENPGSNPSDDSMSDVLEDHPDDPVLAELKAFIEGLSRDEQVDVVTLMWLGRGDALAGEWASLRLEAERSHNNRTAEYLLGVPLLGDYIEEGLAKLELYCHDSTIRSP